MAGQIAPSFYQSRERAIMEIVGYIIIMVIVVVIIFSSGIRAEQKRKKNYRDKLVLNYGKKTDRIYKEGEFEHICGYSNYHKGDFCIDEITWNDLNLDEVFKQMNYTKSSAGEEYLYYLLKYPTIKEKNYDELETRISYFNQQIEERKQLQVALHEIGRTGKYSIYDYLHNLDDLGERSSKKDILIDLLFVPAILLMIYHIGYGIGAIFILVLYNIITYFKEKEKIEPYITCFSYVFRILRSVDIIKEQKIELLKQDKERLSELKKGFTKFRRFSYLIMSKSRLTGNPTEIGIDYARMFLHIDIIKFNSMLKEVRKHQKDIDEILLIIGKIDVALSIGEYRTFLHDYCIPQFETGCYEAKNLYHPLLMHPVKNDLKVEKSILLTGSNASGKSTFLKTIALNAILAQTIHTVAADSYHADYYKIYTSLSVKDNIFDGDSYYMAEIKSIKRIIDEEKESTVPILGFVDEVLRGTNTVERIAASSIILKSMAGYKGFIFAATHDVELTEILKDEYCNMHFEEEIRDDDIYFPYKILNGKALSKNAILLLEMMGYDNDIVKKANDMALNFEANGKWN